MPDKLPDIVFSIDAEILGGFTASAVLVAPGYEMSGSFGGHLDANAPGYSSAGLIDSGAVLRLIANAPGYSITAEAEHVDYMSADLDAPGYESFYAILDSDVSLFGIRASMSELFEFDPANFDVYSVNAKTGAISDYSNYPFEFMARFEGRHYGFNQNGAFLLEGDDDAGTEIDAYFEIPPTDFDTAKKKRLPYVYLNGDSGGVLSITATVDEGISATRATKNLGRTRRASLPKGLEGDLWAVKVANIDGNHLKVDTLELLPSVLRRKI